ncbi:helicase-associated domain-containing protein [Fodinicola feengrottensis]|uniref:helicase-associated domain-containing protein n=1 Tax=Fodinicola feengrottensis TaxID=435914 RepID=UPI0013D106DD|nr:helicase-associated domain-containing protein [Fodinicola feengrottensis]
MSPLDWAVARGLLFVSMWDNTELVMPSEVMLALRDGGFTAPFEPRRPEVEHWPVEPALVAQDSLAAAGRFLRLVTEILDQAGRKPIPSLKSGRLNVQERRRVAKTVDTAAEVNAVVRLALSAELLAVTDKALSPTEAYDDWRLLDPADQLANLLSTWWTLPAPASPDKVTHPDLDISPLRRNILRVAAATGEAVNGERAVTAGFWAAPACWPDDLTSDDGWATWQEAVLLGVIGAEAVSPAGLALLAEDQDGLRKAFDGVGETEHTVRLQTDLTAVVSGTPSAQLRALLDLVADRETRGTASTWRFSPASVRRALDSGYPLEDLLGDLEAAASGSLPQPLGYLIRDVGRTHGGIRAVEVACCLRSEDAALLTEIVADRRLRALGLWTLAPTVVASPRPLAAETLDALRTAGFAPVAESADGVPMLERVVHHRADPAGKRRTATVSRTTDPAELARLLLASSDHDAALTPPSNTTNLLRPQARRLSDSDSDLRILADAIDEQRPVSIDYVTQNGGHSRRVIEQIELDGAVLHAYCRLREDDRAFTLSRILSVEPVTD